jgi:hypothetical protein
MIDRIQVIAELMALQARLHAVGRLVQAQAVGECIELVLRV